MTRKHGSNRRQFLTGRAAQEALADLVVGQPEQAAAPPLSKPATYLLEVGRSAMACQWQILLNAGQYPSAADVALQALDVVEQLEEQLSVFRPHSEVNFINQQAAQEPVRVEQGLFQLLELAQQLAQDTGGAFDITATPLWKVWGFQGRAGEFPTQQAIDRTLELVGHQYVELDHAAQTVRLAKPGVEISFGAIGKGYALDRCSQLLHQAGIEDFLIHGGQSSVLAAGARMMIDQQQQGWLVALCHPLRQQERLGHIRLRNRALATSGSGKQYFHYQGRRYGHILDPRSGYPAEQIWSATVLAPQAAVADALATALLVMGPEAALAYCQERPELAAILICPASRSGSTVIHTVGLEQDDWMPLKQS